MLSEEKTPSGEKSPIVATLLSADKVIAVSLGTILRQPCASGLRKIKIDSPLYPLII